MSLRALDLPCQWLGGGAIVHAALHSPGTVSPGTVSRVAPQTLGGAAFTSATLVTLACGYQVTLGGDFLAPSLLSSLDQGQSMVQALNAVPVDVVCFGNHESDVSYTALQRRIKEFKGVWLNSNMPGFPNLPHSHTLTVNAPGRGGSSRSIGFLGFLIGGGRFASTYRKGAFGGHADSIVPVLDAAPRSVRCGYCVCALPMREYVRVWSANA